MTAATELGLFSVTDYGAAGDGSTNDTSAFNTAIAAVSNYMASGANGTLYIPGGSYVLNELTPIASAGGLCIRGAGRRSSILIFAPTANNQTLLEINKSGFVANHSLLDFSVRSSDTSYDKTAIKLVDCGTITINNVQVYSWGGDGTDSVAMHLEGRENFWVSDVALNAVVPLFIGKNPNTSSGYLSGDHFTFQNMYLVVPSDQTPNTLPSACVLIESGVHVSQLHFTGSQAWVGGQYGLYWNQATNPYTNSTNVTLHNVRTEQGTSATAWSVYINLGTFNTNPSLYNFSALNCEFDAAREGIYLRNVWNCSLRDTSLRQSTSRKITDVGGAMSMVWDNVDTLYNAPTAAVSVDSNLYFVRADPVPSSRVWPLVASWARRNTSASYDERPSREMSAHKWYWGGQLTNGQALQIPVNNTNDWEHARIEVTATIEGSNILAYGTWYAAPVTGLANGVVLAGGSANAVATDTNLKLCVFCDGASPMDPGVYVKNRLGATAYVSVEVTGKRSVET